MGNSVVTQRDTQLEKQRAGYIKLSLTNFTTSAEPTIAAGSVVEISGSLYSFTTNESITGWAAVGVGDAYIKLVPDGTNPCTAEFTATAPTWSDAKQGWYDGTGTDRYVAGLYKTSATEYDRKHIFSERDSPTLNGDNTFTGENAINVSQITGLTYGDIGTYVIAASSAWSTSTTYLAGTTVDGSTLFRSDYQPNLAIASLNSFSDDNMVINTFTNPIGTSGQTAYLSLTGTWTLMTRITRSSSSQLYPVGLFLRTA